MAKLIYPVNISLDGYMEDENGKLDWSLSDDEIFDFWTEFQRSIGTYLYGRLMYQSMVYWDTENPQTPANFTGSEQEKKMAEFARIWQSADKMVYSTTLMEAASGRTTIYRELNVDAIRNLKNSSAAPLTIGGADVAAQALEIGLVDELYLLVHPIILGGGKRAFPEHLRLKLKLLEEREFSSGVVHLHYSVEK